MQITAFERRGDYFYRVTFSRDGESVEKTVQLTGLMLRLTRDPKRDWFLTLRKAALEADRDIAFRHHGAAFRDHTEYKGDITQLLPQSELDKLFHNGGEVAAG